MLRPQRVNFFNDAAMSPRQSEHDAAAGKSWECFDGGVFRGGSRCDSLVPQICGVVECAWIAIIARRHQSRRESDALSVAKELHRARWRSFWRIIRFNPRIDVQPDPGVDASALRGRSS